MQSDSGRLMVLEREPVWSRGNAEHLLLLMEGVLRAAMAYSIVVQHNHKISHLGS